MEERPPPALRKCRYKLTIIILYCIRLQTLGAFDKQPLYVVCGMEVCLNVLLWVWGYTTYSYYATINAMKTKTPISDNRGLARRLKSGMF